MVPTSNNIKNENTNVHQEPGTEISSDVSSTGNNEVSKDQDLPDAKNNLYGFWVGDFENDGGDGHANDRVLNDVRS